MQTLMRRKITLGGFIDKRFLMLQFISLVSVWVSPWVISTDGNLYLSSAKSIFTNQMYEFFHFLRTPGYPILIKVVTLDRFLLPLFILQAFLLALAIHLTARAFERIGSIQPKYSLVISILTLLVLRGYITAVLMQVLLLFLISLCIDFNSRILVLKPNQPIKIHLYLYYFLVCFFSIITFPLLGVATSVSTTFAIVSRFPQEKIKVSCAVSVNLFLCLLFIFSWSSLQNRAIESGLNNFPASTSVAKFKFFDSDERDKRFEQRLQASAAILGLAPERYGYDSYSIGSEIKNYALPTFNTNVYDSPLQCGRYDSISDPVKTFIEELRSSNRFCRSPLTLEVSNFFNQGMRYFYFMWAFCFLAGLVFSLLKFRSKEFFLGSETFLSYGAYVLLGAGASRYGAPCFMISGFLLMSIFGSHQSARNTEVHLLKSRKSKVRI